MRSDYTGHITSAEWRWVILVASFLVALAFVPFLWVMLVDAATSEWRFMGALHYPSNVAASLMQTVQGSKGQWLVHVLYSPEPHSGNLAGLLYTLLGQFSRLTGLPQLIVLHLARIGASLFMYIALYQLASGIWVRVRTRRIFFVFAAIGAGFGWIFAPLTGDTSYLDLGGFGVFPFQASLVNVHFPLTMGALAISANFIVYALRPGTSLGPTVQNGGPNLLLLGLLIGVIYPIPLLPVVLAFAACLGVSWYTRRVVLRGQIYWFMWFSIPTLPMVAYFYALLQNDVVAEEVWRQQSQATVASPLVLALSLGLPLLIAVPGLGRAIRRFEPDGDQFMLLWLVAMMVAMYWPGGPGMLLGFAMMIPLTYFVTRAIEDFWLTYIQRRWRKYLFAALIPVLVTSHLLVLLVPTIPISAGEFSHQSGIFLQRNYLEAFNWLKVRAEGRVVLAAPATSLWLPTVAVVQTVYGHPTMTIDAQTKEAKVKNWYAETDPKRCDALLQGDLSATGVYTVQYVLYGPQERALGDSVCLDQLTQVRNYGDVAIYAYSP